MTAVYRSRINYMQVSIVNALAALTPTFSTEDASYPAANTREPERQLTLWKTTATTEQWIKYNIPQPTAAGGVLIGLFNGNVASIDIQANTSDSFGSPPISQALGLIKHPSTGRYGAGAWFKTFPYTWVRFRIQSQARLDGASVYSLGGTWLGDSERVPTQPLAYPFGHNPINPRVIAASAASEFEDTVTVGDKRMRFRIGRRAKVSLASPGVSDEWGQWLDLDRRWGTGPVCAMLAQHLPGSTFMVKRTSDIAWSRDRAQIAESEIELSETLGP